MSFRRRTPRRLDLMILGASPKKLAEQTEIPAVIGPALTCEQSERLYTLNHRYERGLSPLSPAEQLERAELKAKLSGGRHARR